jgi:hypothetical protein
LYPRGPAGVDRGAPGAVAHIPFRFVAEVLSPRPTLLLEGDGAQLREADLYLLRDTLVRELR